MRIAISIILTSIFIFSLTMVYITGETYGQDMPPVVIKTVPQSGETDVDSSITEIKVTFNKDMITDNMWSWVKVSDDTFPEIIGKVRYQMDKRTCVLPVKLEPNTTYKIWINSDKFNNFKDTNNNPAVPYFLTFRTGE